MLKVVFDTNVYISAILTSGTPRKILNLAREEKFNLFISEPVLLEVERVLRLKVKLDSFKISIILDSIRDISIFVSPSFTLSVVERDKSDDRILECALEAKADYIISGDSHLLSLKEYQGIKILSPVEFLKLFL
jgi:putative PIN family toxin of toxin-antitoxin system